jgi:hypothetical protein
MDRVKGMPRFGPVDFYSLCNSCIISPDAKRPFIYNFPDFFIVIGDFPFHDKNIANMLTCINAKR